MRAECDCGSCHVEFETEAPHRCRAPQPAAGARTSAARAPRSFRLGGYLLRRRPGGGATEICHAPAAAADWPCAHEPAPRRWTLRDETVVEFCIEVLVVVAILATLAGVSLAEFRSPAASHSWPTWLAQPAMTEGHGRQPVVARERVVGAPAGDRQTPNPAPADGI